ncbi:hypothetical protein GSI_02439 [Ganoderma sinense ZZ0214-1]|uniref:Probable quinone oxidoreductase n=1 Tax=Ganoderma sinense ZZ0214-1 TaxID=1077348 RepID=A0A2G8SPL4_9APHY|nr:hypothetical protein GSI_02439 [Ganoderma sinense ZZ0214-1]
MTFAFPSRITAVGISKPGGLDAIETLNLPFPSPEPNQLIVKVAYVGVNFFDIQQRAGLYPVPSLPAPLGQEAAGIVVALPSDEALLSSEGFKESGLEIESPAYFVPGAFAEYVTPDWSNAVLLPPSVSTREGAAAFAQGMTAITFTAEAYDVQPGDYVFVHTVAGGLGLWLTQIVKHLGGIVIGTTSTKEKAAVAKAHGADHVILYKDEDVVAHVLELTGGEGVHAIYDGVGKDTFQKNFEMIRFKGTIVSMGAASGALEPFDPRKLLRKNVKYVFPSASNYLRHPKNGRQYLTELYGLIASGVLEAVVSMEYPLTAEGVAQAQRDQSEGKSIGKAEDLYAGMGYIHWYYGQLAVE